MTTQLHEGQGSIDLRTHLDIQCRLKVQMRDVAGLHTVNCSMYFGFPFAFVRYSDRPGPVFKKCQISK